MTKKQMSRSEAAFRRDEAIAAMHRADNRLAGLLAMRDAATHERERFAAGRVPLEDTTPISAYSVPNERGHLASGGTPNYYQETDPKPETIAEAEENLRLAQSWIEAAEQELQATPETDPVAEARKVGAPWIARRTFDWGDRRFFAGAPVRLDDLPGLTSQKRRAMLARGSLLQEVGE
jgi:hypothetical protein